MKILPSRKWHTVSIAITVKAFLPIRLPAMLDWQIFGGKSHSVTSTCWFVVTVIWYVGAGGVLLSVWFSLCHDQLHLEKLLPEFTVQTLLGQKSHLTCEPLDLLCPQTRWWHFLQCGGTLVVVSPVLETLVSLKLWLEIGNGCEVGLTLAISWWSCLIVFSNSSCSISLAVVVSVGECNPESDPSCPLSRLTAGTSVLELGLRIACFAVWPSSWTFSFRKSLLRGMNLSHSSRYCGRNERNLLKLSSHRFG